MNHRAWTGWSFLILGIMTAVFGIVVLTTRLRALDRWTHVDGEVVESVVLGPDIDEMYTPHVTIRWIFNGAEYSKKFSIWGSAGGTGGFDRILARYPKGSRAPILCDPSNPGSAMLEAGYTVGFFIVPAAVILGGIAAAVLGYFIKPASL